MGSEKASLAVLRLRVRGSGIMISQQPLIGFSAAALTVSKRRTVGLGCKGAKPLLEGMVPRKGSAKAPSWPPWNGHGGIGGSRNAPLIGDRTARRLCMVRCRWRGTSPSPASGFRGRGSPLIDGCREREFSREWLIGDTIFWLRKGFNALTEPRPGGCNGGAQRAPLPRCVVVQHTSCFRSNGTDFAVLQALLRFRGAGQLPDVDVCAAYRFDANLGASIWPKRISWPLAVE